MLSLKELSVDYFGGFFTTLQLYSITILYYDYTISPQIKVDLGVIAIMR